MVRIKLTFKKRWIIKLHSLNSNNGNQIYNMDLKIMKIWWKIIPKYLKRNKK